MGSTVDVVCVRLISVSGGVAVLTVLLVTSANSVFFNFDLLDRQELQTWQGWREYRWDPICSTRGRDIGVRRGGLGVE
jgi:hypothetical protein